MSEPRRVSLQPVVPMDRLGMADPSVGVAGTAPNGGTPAKKKKKLTMRFKLDLGDPNEDVCHEFNYIELVRNFKRNKPEAPDDHYESDDDDVATIAKKMEEKYGTGKVAWDDDVDKGQGYDEDDSFIDNGEAYDELVPLDLNTKYGGFYINTGGLEFVQAPLAQYMSDKIDVNKTKATLEDSPDDVSEEDSEREPSPKPHVKEKDKQKRRKRKKLESEDSKDQNSSEKKKKLSVSIPNPPPTKKKVRRIESSSDDEEPEKIDKEIEKKERLSMKQERQLDDAIEAVVRHARELNKKEVEEEEMELLRQQEEEMEREERENERKRKEKERIERQEREKSKALEKAEKAQAEKERCEAKISENSESMNVKMPERMPRDLEARVREITSMARESSGKSKFFQTYGVRDTLLTIDLMARQALPCSQRTQLYCYLAAHLPCSKETLLKRVKKLRLDEEDNKVKEPMIRFKAELTRISEEQVQRYRRKCEAIGQTPCNISDSEGEEDVQLHRKFEWSDDLRGLFREVVALKIKTYEVSKLRATSAEDYVKNFFDIDMVILWPRGWMHSRTLLRMAHEDNLIPKSRNELTPSSARKLTQLQNIPGTGIHEPQNQSTTTATTPYRPRLNSLSSIETPLKETICKDLTPTDLTPTSTLGTSVIKEKVKEELSSPPSSTPMREARDSGHSVHSVISNADIASLLKDERPVSPLSIEPHESPVHMSVITSPTKQSQLTSTPTPLPQVETPVFRDSFVPVHTPKKQSATPLLKANYQAALQKSPPFNSNSLQSQNFAEFAQKMTPTYSQSPHKMSHQSATTSPAAQYQSTPVSSSYQQPKYQQSISQQEVPTSNPYHAPASSAPNFYGSQSHSSLQSQSLPREKEPMLPSQVIDRIISQQLATNTYQNGNGHSSSQGNYSQSSVYQNESSQTHRTQNSHSQPQKSPQLPRSAMPSSYNIYEALQQLSHKETKPQPAQNHQQSMGSVSSILQHSRSTPNLEGMKGFPSPMSAASSVPSYYTSSSNTATSYLQNQCQPAAATQSAHSANSATSHANRYPWASQTMYTAQQLQQQQQLHQQRQYYQQQDQRRSMNHRQPDNNVHRP